MTTDRSAASTVVIRPTQLSDLPSLVEGLNPVFLERYFLAITEAIAVPEATAYHARSIAAGYPHFVAVDRERVVGVCDIVPAAASNVSAQQHMGCLGLWLIPDYRGQGLGERLLRAALSAGRSQFERIELTVYSHNERAYTLYQRCGFIEEGRRRGAWKLDGRTSDIVAMGLLYAETPPESP